MTEPKPPNPGTSMSLVGPERMSDRWRQLRDAIQDGISDTVRTVETAQRSGELVLGGFGVDIHSLGHTTTRHGSRLGVRVSQPGVPGLHLDVREGKLQEASRVIPGEEGTTVVYARMPNFEPGHSKEVGEYAPIDGTMYEIGRQEFSAKGGSTSHSVRIDHNGMVKSGGWNGEATVAGMVTNDARLEQLKEWADSVMAEITG